MAIEVSRPDPAPPGKELEQRVARAYRLSERQRDQLLYELVISYRCGGRSAWAPLVLRVMERSLKIRVSRYRPADAAMGIEDIYQQLACEVLQDALTIPLQGPAFLERRLILRSADRVSRWLQREFDRSEGVESLEAWAAEYDDDEKAGEELS